MHNRVFFRKMMTGFTLLLFSTSLLAMHKGKRHGNESSWVFSMGAITRDVSWPPNDRKESMQCKKFSSVKKKKQKV